jgi:hypothetical protein
MLRKARFVGGTPVDMQAVRTSVHVAGFASDHQDVSGRSYSNWASDGMLLSGEERRVETEAMEQRAREGERELRREAKTEAKTEEEGGGGAGLDQEQREEEGDASPAVIPGSVYIRKFIKVGPAVFRVASVSGASAHNEVGSEVPCSELRNASKCVLRPPLSFSCDVFPPLTLFSQVRAAVPGRRRGRL